jgi:hypothetical protein
LKIRTLSNSFKPGKLELSTDFLLLTVMNFSELSSQSSPQSHSSFQLNQLEKHSQPNSNRLSEMLQNLVSLLAGTSELSIQECSQKDGSKIWKIYDPHTQSKVVFTSENEVRAWIEQRYSSR